VLTGHVQRLPAGGQDNDAGSLAGHRAGQRRAGVHQVLAGIEDQQQPAVAQVGQDGGQLRPGILLGQPEGGRDGVRQQLRVAQPGQLGQADPVAELAGQASGRAERHARLADPAGAGHRHQPGAA
jgi:hypothetical protein